MSLLQSQKQIFRQAIIQHPHMAKQPLISTSYQYQSTINKQKKIADSRRNNQTAAYTARHLSRVLTNWPNQYFF